MTLGILLLLLVLFLLLLLTGILIKGERFYMIQNATGRRISVKRGFSFTYLFFGPFVPLFRGHIGGFFLTFFVELFSLGIARLILLFCYNGMYINWLAANGYYREVTQSNAVKDQVLPDRKTDPVVSNQNEYRKIDGILEPVAGELISPEADDDVTVDLTSGKIEVLSGVYKGAVIEVQTGDKITVGRDESLCSLVISEKAISRKHCEITYDTFKRCFYITDYSKNGVYLDNGQKIQTEISVILKPGTTIQLGSTNNIFLLRA
jgi:hypothetical protein